MAAGEAGDGSIAAAFRLLRAVLNSAIAADLIARNPTQGVRPPAPGSGEMHFLTAQQVAQLVDEVGDRYRALILLLAYGGLRIGEACALRVDDLDLLRGRVLVQRSVTDVGGRMIEGPTKSRSKRTVTVPKFLRETLGEHVGCFSGGDGHVFTGTHGDPIHVRNFRRRVWVPALQRMKLGDWVLGSDGLDRFVPALRIHDLRHTCAALLIAQGAHVKEIADRLGHSSPVVTLNTYAHILPSLEERLSNGLEETYRTTQETRGVLG